MMGYVQGELQERGASLPDMLRESLDWSLPVRREKLRKRLKIEC